MCRNVRVTSNKRRHSPGASSYQERRKLMTTYMKTIDLKTNSGGLVHLSWDDTTQKYDPANMFLGALDIPPGAGAGKKEEPGQYATGM
jgi:hypothetical protein